MTVLVHQFEGPSQKRILEPKIRLLFGLIMFVNCTTHTGYALGDRGPT